MEHLKKYWWVYLIIIILIVAYFNRDKVNQAINGVAGRGKPFTQCLNGTLYVSACPTCPSAASGPCSTN